MLNRGELTGQRHVLQYDDQSISHLVLMQDIIIIITNISYLGSDVQTILERDENEILWWWIGEWRR